MLRGWNTAQHVTQYGPAANISNEEWTSLRAYVDRYHALNASAVGIVSTTDFEISSANSWRLPPSELFRVRDDLKVILYETCQAMC